MFNFFAASRKIDFNNWFKISAVALARTGSDCFQRDMQLTKVFNQFSKFFLSKLKFGVS